MNATVKQSWLDALRSGKYRQGRGVLKVKDADDQVCHCVLGVLAEVCGADWASDGSTPCYALTTRLGTLSRANLTTKILREAGLPATPFVKVPRELSAEPWVELCSSDTQGQILRGNPANLASLNDAGAPFELLADLIEAQL